MKTITVTIYLTAAAANIACILLLGVNAINSFAAGWCFALAYAEILKS